MTELTKSQKAMLDDGFPPEFFLSQEDRRAGWLGKRPRPTIEMAFAAPRKDEDPVARQLRKEEAARQEKKKAERLARLKESRDQTLKAMVRAVDGPKKQPAAQPAKQESDMKKNAAKTPAPKKAAAKKQAPAKSKAKKAATQKARTPVSGKPDVVQQIADMMAAPGGASMAEMVKATGIEPHPMRAKIKLVRDRLGYTTTAPGKDNDYRYHATAPKKAPGKAAE